MEMYLQLCRLYTTWLKSFFLTNLFALLSPTAAKPGRTVNFREISSTTSSSSSRKKPKKSCHLFPIKHTLHQISHPPSHHFYHLPKERSCLWCDGSSNFYANFLSHPHSFTPVRELMRGAFVRVFALLSTRDISESIWNENLVSEEFPDFRRKGKVDRLTDTNFGDLNEFVWFNGVTFLKWVQNLF